MQDLSVGVDIGGTKTHVRVCRNSYTIDELIVPSSDWRRRNWARDALGLLDIVSRIADVSAVTTLVVGAHGCDDNADCVAYETALASHLSGDVKVVSDAELIPAALGVKNGIGLVVGTGSVAVCRDQHDQMLIAGGWGWIIGDEGSASGLFREAARAVRLSLECGNSDSDPLTTLLFEALDISAAARIGTALAALGSAAELGKHAPVIFQAADMGSDLAKSVIEGGVDGLVDLIARLKKNGAVTSQVVVGGGLIVAQPRLAERLLEQIASRFQGQVSAEIFWGPPVQGACLMAGELSLTAPDPIQN